VKLADKRQAGLNPANAYKLSVGISGIAMFGNCCAWLSTTFFGRRTIYLIGLALMTLLMYIIGFLSLAPNSNTGATWATAVMRKSILLPNLAYLNSHSLDISI